MNVDPMTPNRSCRALRLAGFNAERRSLDTMRSARGMSLDVARDERIKVKSSRFSFEEDSFVTLFTPVMLNLFQHPLILTGDKFWGTMDPETRSG